MCGRYIQVSSPTLLVEHFDVDEIAIEENPVADYNVAPRKEILTIVQRDHLHGAGSEGDPVAETEPTEPIRVLEQMRWGLVPSWAKDERIGDRLINARAESVAEKPAFKAAFRKRRCIIPADGFYEWQRFEGTKKKQPMFVHRRDGEPIGFAGLWEVWRENADAPWLLSCTIVTTHANSIMEPIHDRMPVMLPEAAWKTWLDVRVNDQAQLESLLVPAPDAQIEVWPVSTMVNSANNNGPELVDRVEPIETETQNTLFS